MSEDNANLLWSPSALEAGSAGHAASLPSGRGGARFALAREQLSALHPTFLRLLIDWAAVQPRAGRAPDLEAPVSGCARATPPCAPYAGVREELAAIATQQRAGPGFQVVIDIFGTPAWAARPPSGCERASAGAFSRAPSAAGLAAYRSLVHALVALAQREGVALDWWAPWNEPNDPSFLSPQRASCTSAAGALAPLAYARLARALAAQLRAEGGQRHLLLGELNAYSQGSLERTSPAEFVQRLPADVLCLGDHWSVHAYAGRGAFAPARDPVSVLEAALDARAGCAAHAAIWVTEAGAGAPHPGEPRVPGAGEERAGCLALASQLLAWSLDPRVQAVFQYTFRDDPAFPVGLLDAALTRPYGAYRLWLAWAQARDGSRPGAPGGGACS